jgi:hypothetical protein
MKKTRNNLHLLRGAAAVEFAIVAMLLFTLLFGIIEFGRLFYIINTVQEVTRRAAREAVVNWIDASSQDMIKRTALFGGSSLPAGAEITPGNIEILYLTEAEIAPVPMPTTPAENISACLSGPTGCIALVRVSITGATYAPMVSLFPYFSIPIPASTVTMPAESMGYSG